MAEAWLWPAGLGLLGAVFGSFIATVAMRWPAGRSVSTGRSHCDGCDRPLSTVELVPLLSYAAQRGRCRACAARIDPLHFVVELLALAIGVSAGCLAPNMAGVAGAIFGWQLLALAALDLRAFWLPDHLTGALAVTGLVGGIAGLDPDLGARLLGGIAGYAALWLVAWGYCRLRGRVGLGGGDPKLFGAIGLWLGAEALPLVLLLASMIGLIAVLSMRVAGRAVHADDRLPLGVMLAIAAYGIWLFQAAAL